ncbi:MAG: DUF2442 domain-containing protein [Chloroflexi bacterium]|nr:DUF2442 domain-containing protein [Chloroflexota bacterium]
MKAVRYIDGYTLELTFGDGVVARLDFQAKVCGRGGVFAPLADTRVFRQVAVDSESGTLVWPNGVDLDPDVLYSEATGKTLPMPQAA